MIPTPGCNLLVCKRRRPNRTEACLRHVIADAISAFAETGRRHLRISRRDMHQFPGRRQTRTKRGTVEQLLSRPQPWRPQERSLFRACVCARESESTEQEQSAQRPAAIRSAQLDAATNARPFQQPAFLPILHFELAASYVARSPNEYRTRLWPARFRANVCRPASICE